MAKKSNRYKIILGILFIFILTGGFIGYKYYQKIFADNVKNAQEQYEVFIPTGAGYEEVLDTLNALDMLEDDGDFNEIAGYMDYPGNVKSGRYIIDSDMSNRDIVQRLRGGTQTPVRLTIRKVRTKEAFADFIATKLEVQKDTLLKLLNDSTYLAKKGFSPETVIGMFLTDTYEFYWNIKTRNFFDRMLHYYHQFWNEERKAKAEENGLSPIEVITLASIVEEETVKDDEKARVAGLYLNRINRGMRLQADPTVKFATGDFAKKRIYTADTELEHPYNTYFISGLPPGPINIPYRSSIEAVLNAEDHDYYYMVAREDLSGYHNFSKTHDQHINNKRKYIRAINERGIR